MAHRTVIFLTFWLALWMGVGAVIGHLFFYTLWTGVANGLVFGVATTLLWPWILPRALDDWLDGHAT